MKAEREEAEKLCHVMEENNDADPETEKYRLARAQLAIACLSVIADSFTVKRSNDDTESLHLQLADREENPHREFAIPNPKCISPIYGIPHWPAEFVQFDMEAGPLDAFELNDLQVNAGYVFN